MCFRRTMIGRHSSAVLLTILAACGGGGDGPTPPPPAPTVSLSATAIELDGLGSSNVVTAIVAPASATITWRSDAPTIATVQGSGRSATITAVASGTTAVIAEVVIGSQRAEARATVVVRPRVRRIELTPASVSLSVGQAQTFVATLTADAGADTRVSWRTTDASRVTIDSLGRATALAPGNAQVIVSSLSAQLVADTSTVVVTAVPRVRSVAVLPARDTLVVNATRTYAVTVDADSGLTRAVQWRSSAPTIATVDASGRVSAVAIGSTTITAVAVADTTQRGGLALVVRAPAVQSLRVTAARTAIVAPDTVRVAASVTADPGVSTAVLFESLSETVATVSSTGLVTSIGPGIAVIRVSTVATPVRSDSVMITVAAPPVPTQWINSYDARTGEWQLLAEVTAMAAHAPSSAIYAVGGLTQGRVYEENAAGQWRSMPLPAGPPLRAVSASDAGVWAVGDGGRILRLSGNVWTDESSGTARNLTQISMRNDGSGIAVGTGALLLERRNSVWSVVNDSAAGGANLPRLALVQVAPTGRTVYMLWNRREAPFAGTDVIRFDGTTWSGLAPTDAGRNGALSITVAGAGDVVVAGVDDSAFRWYLARLSGSGWIREYTVDAGTTATSAVGHRCADGSMLLTTGQAEVLLRTGGTPVNPFADGRERFSGGTLACRTSTDWTWFRSTSNVGRALWRITPTEVRSTGFLGMLSGVSIGSGTNIWAMNERFGGTTLRFDGTRWIPEILRRGSSIGSPTTIAAVGSATAYIATGQQFGVWSPSTTTWSATPGFLNRIWASGPLALWGAMSNNSVDNRRGLQRWSGAWSNANVPPAATSWNFGTVHGVPGTSVVMALGAFPLNRGVLRAVGSGFAVDTVSVNGTETLSRLAVTSATDAVVVGFRGSARWNGTLWQPLETLSSTSFTAVTGRPGEYYAFTADRGIHALIGTRWIRIGTSAEIVRDASMVNETAIAVGDNGYIGYGRPSAAARRQHTRVGGTPSDMRPR